MSHLIQACDLTRRYGEGDRILVYLISRLKEKQVLTCTNLFCTAETEDRLDVSVDVRVLNIFYQELCALVDGVTPVSCMYSIIIKADINNKMKEIETDEETEMKKWMSKSADWVGGLMECFIIGSNIK